MFQKHHNCLIDGCARNGRICGESRGLSPCKVDTKGYIPMRKQVERALAAGERLTAFRKEMFGSADPDYFNESDLSVIDDPDFMPSVDMEGVIESQQQKIAAKMQHKLQASPAAPAQPAPPSQKGAEGAKAAAEPAAE